MQPTLRFTNRALHDLKRLDAPTRARIMASIKQYADSPPQKAVRLKGGGDTLRIRIGDWRVLFLFHSMENTIEIQRVAHRSQAYR